MAVERGRTGSHRSQRSIRSSYSDTRSRKPLGARIKDCCRSTIAFIFSNVGVCGLMVGYTIMGAFLFEEIEGPKEMAKYYSVASHRDKTVERLWNITVAFNTLYPENWTESVEQEVKNYQNYIVEVVGEGWDGSNKTYGPTQWSFEGGFLYSLTVITTIGYGHIVPRTPMGKIVTIFYTIFGMPVFLLYMANMGDILAKSLKWVYAKVCICKKAESQYDPSVVWRSADAILRSTAIPTFLPPSDEFPTPHRSQHPQQHHPYHTHHHQHHHHHPYSRRDDFEDDDDDDDDDDFDDREIRTVSGHLHRQDQSGYSSQYGRRVQGAEERGYGYQGMPAGERDPREMLYMNDAEEGVSIESQSGGSPSEKTDVSSVNIPITVSLLIMVALLYGGTKMFQAYESWDALTSFYFCFISLTTIGFGDYVPGSSVASISSGNQMSFIYCSLYLMFGLALLSMCFNLMQEEVVHKFTTCVKSISIGRKKDPE